MNELILKSSVEIAAATSAELQLHSSGNFIAYHNKVRNEILIRLTNNRM
jgi:hypothetical protein